MKQAPAGRRPRGRVRSGARSPVRRTLAVASLLGPDGRACPAGDTIQAVPRAGYVSFMYSCAPRQRLTSCLAARRCSTRRHTAPDTAARTQCAHASARPALLGRSLGRTARAARRYPNLLPLPAEEVERIRAAVAGWRLDFDCLYGGAPPWTPRSLTPFAPPLARAVLLSTAARMGHLGRGTDVAGFRGASLAVRRRVVWAGGARGCEGRGPAVRGQVCGAAAPHGQAALELIGGMGVESMLAQQRWKHALLFE